jgi:hypothetical protein
MKSEMGTMKKAIFFINLLIKSFTSWIYIKAAHGRENKPGDPSVKIIF